VDATNDQVGGSSFQQFAFERKEQDQHGVMTFYLLEVLKSGTTSLRVRDLHNYVVPRVSKYVADNFPGSPQTPACSDQTPRPAFVRTK
jgi:hypothetical protein